MNRYLEGVSRDDVGGRFGTARSLWGVDRCRVGGKRPDDERGVQNEQRREGDGNIDRLGARVRARGFGPFVHLDYPFLRVLSASEIGWPLRSCSCTPA